MSDGRGVPGFTHVDHIGLTVPDLDAAVKFYVDVFGATELYRLGPFDAAQIPRMPDGRDWTEAHINVPGARLSMATLQIGANLMLELMRYEKPADARPEPPRNCDIGAHHVAFKVQNLGAAIEYLRGKGVRVLAGPIVLDQGPCAGLRCQYCLDPFGNSLELIEYGELPWMANSPVRPYRP